MVGWAQICPAIIDLFKVIAVDDPARGEAHEWRPEWMERKREAIHPEHGHSLFLKITTCQGLGQDETRYVTSVVDGEEELYAVQCGQRKFNLQVQSHCLEHLDDFFAIQVLERVRTRVQNPSSIDALLSVGVSIIQIMPSVKATATIDRRRVSIANMDITMGAVVNDADPIPVGWIEHVNIESRVRVGDAILPSPPNNAPGEWVPPLPDDDP